MSITHVTVTDNLTSTIITKNKRGYAVIDGLQSQLTCCKQRRALSVINMQGHTKMTIPYIVKLKT